MTGGKLDLAALEAREAFIHRHIGPSEADIADMLDGLGLASLDALTDQAVPGAIRGEFPDSLAGPRSEQDVLGELARLAGRNKIAKSMIGMGYYDTHTPTVILRNLLENPGWYTAYTPYQPEISQGRLEALLVFQTMVMDLTGMDCANASLLDEATAAAEAVNMSHGVAKKLGDAYFVSEDCHPQTIAVLRTRARAAGIAISVGDHRTALDDGAFFGALLQYPASGGALEDYRAFIDAAHEKGMLVTVAADLLSLVSLVPPGEFGADIVVGSAQRFGVPMGFGGPHAAFFATHEKYRRVLPGRIVGVSVDDRGRAALRLALQTREQHIRREKATSNICTAQVLLAVMAAMYAVYHGPEGLRLIAARVHRLTSILAAGLSRLGIEVTNKTWFDTLTLELPSEAEMVLARAAQAGINLRHIDGDRLAISLDETVLAEDVDALFEVFSPHGAPGFSVAELAGEAAAGVPEKLRRQSAILAHPAFNTRRSETEMLRYLHSLEVKDITLNHSMIPLGSCTMKLNATTEMIPVTWPGFGRIHPFAPLDQVPGYVEMIEGLERMLCEVTGFAAVSVQPNAGSQGEFSGLLAIRGFHAANGEGGRDVCLIPSSAHGTNPASAVMAGLKVVVVGCDAGGNVDVADLKAKAAEHRDKLAALMVTYPSTHGVFEAAIVEICDIVHAAGGQVYLDGANLNALLGVSLPGAFGPDVAHMNLHKTFCIPHGGGGPGVGPIGVRAHLAPHLPGHPLAASPQSAGPVSAAPCGSAGILPISWAYIAMMGGAGLKKATQTAILNANYIAEKLSPHYPVLYRGEQGRVAHECIIDLRPLKESSGVTVDDVAKRLMDYGFHAPTMSFPVAGTLMIEPTESEPRAELDRFAEAMIAIRGEIKRIEDGDWSLADNPLAGAPHTLEEVAADEWPHAYSREEAAFPVESLRQGKYWPPVGRIDQVHGDRNLICACPPLEAYRNAAE
ncbi:MAG: aminomethyl-transferring glycine dehydrogenase [Alphaproteobacteria bacterium]|jgi:glycine dehydrogenase|nr:aminomethyl-transferring glycine dehydrogenase [Alphaproteobacteria bacterium]MDP6590143.1 aminomethyl-transferring glycine dehydrogenase [Alphaproteobacteria bacterium]MDP6817481.1 aminomethyl-transferring glycine dehydrogenase [Alphaproteobacteria bacterium]